MSKILTLHLWGRKSLVKVDRDDVTYVDRETSLSPMLVYLKSAGTERPVACYATSELHKILHTSRLTAWTRNLRRSSEPLTA